MGITTHTDDEVRGLSIVKDGLSSASESCLYVSITRVTCLCKSEFGKMFSQADRNDPKEKVFLHRWVHPKDA